MEPPVGEQVDNFLNLTYKLDGDIRKPNFLKILWWDGFAFDCQLTNAQVNYTLFRPDGTPIRAKINASFKQHTSAELRVKLEDKATSVLTQIQKAVDAGERITNVAQKIYADANKFLEIAKANDMVNFRKPLQDILLTLPGINEATAKVQGVIQKGQDAVNTAQNAVNTAKITAQKAQNIANSAQNVVSSARNLF